MSDAFIGFQNDTPASVIFQATNLLKSICHNEYGESLGHVSDIIHWSHLNTVQELIEENKDKEIVWGEAVSEILVSFYN